MLSVGQWQADGCAAHQRVLPKHKALRGAQRPPSSRRPPHRAINTRTPHYLGLVSMRCLVRAPNPTPYPLPGFHAVAQRALINPKPQTLTPYLGSMHAHGTPTQQHSPYRGSMPLRNALMGTKSQPSRIHQGAPPPPPLPPPPPALLPPASRPNCGCLLCMACAWLPVKRSSQRMQVRKQCLHEGRKAWSALPVSSLPCSLASRYGVTSAGFSQAGGLGTRCEQGRDCAFSQSMRSTSSVLHDLLCLETAATMMVCRVRVGVKVRVRMRVMQPCNHAHTRLLSWRLPMRRPHWHIL